MKKIISALILAALLPMLCSGCGRNPEASASDPPAPEGSVCLTFIPVGKGDAFLLTGPDGSFWLVDTGKDEDFIRIARTLRRKGVETLEGIFVTHGHHDHVGCLESLGQAFGVKTIFYNPLDDASFSDIRPEEVAGRLGCRAVGLACAEVLDLGGAKTQVWLPGHVDRNNENNNSLILRICHGETAFLLMGDAELEEETEFLQSGAALRADVLKLGHHGEDDASGPRFLDAVAPQIALVAGNARENPESVESTVIDSLRKRNITCYFSEGEGLDFVSDGTSVRTVPTPRPSLAQTAHIRFAEVDRRGQRVTVENPGTAAQDLSGCILWSRRGNEVFVFPEGTVLEPGQRLSVACTDAEIPGDLTWREPGVWKKKRDTARLYDRNLNLLDENDPDQPDSGK